MYDTETRVCLVKQRVAEKRRRQEWRGIYRLSALCMTLFLSLVRMVGAVQGQPMDASGMYGTILLHEGAGGYVLAGVISFTAAVVITAVYQTEGKGTPQERHRKGKHTNGRIKRNEKTKKTDLCNAALCLHGIVPDFCPGISCGNERNGGQPRTHVGVLYMDGTMYP